MSQAVATAKLPTAESEVAPQLVAGRYTLLEKLGAGGMGSVHRARDEASGCIVAFKQLSSSLAGSKRRTLEALFEREYHTLVRLKHPRIIEVYDYGLMDSGPYYTMELLDGQDLQQLAPLPYKEACRHLRDVASSLALIHAHRLVHRDVSSRNVRLTRDGRAKLIDFGALTAFGPASDVVGTPLCMAPEILRRMPLDHRTDFYALGTVAYWAVTGQHAYPARRFDELPLLWQRPPAPPSQHVPGIPPALDSLIMSLLSLDPLGRPSSAAAVIDQLTALAELPAEEHDHAAESYLSSGRMVGRKGESQWVQKRMARALKGKGAEVLIEGPAGVGKTRLLHEIGLDAQLKGVVLLKADAQAAPGFFGAAAVLAANLLGACPELARRALGANLELIAHLSPELREKLDQTELVKLTFDSNERRARFQTALYDWFLAVARERTLLIAVDNVHAADDNSAAFLAALGSCARETNLIILVTQRSGDSVVAKAAVQSLRKRSSRLKLAGLSASACEELVSSLFGDVANTGRVARLLFEKSAGNPQLCMDLAQLLVKKKIARYVGGTWVLPLDVSADELPSRIEEILASKLDGLSARARALAEALSIHVKPVPIELCLSATSDRDEQTALAALDELVAEQILGIEGSTYRFAQEALREALLRQIDDTERKTIHLRAAETLLGSAGDSLELRMEAAWHFLHGGEEGRGADLLAATGQAFLKAQGATESVDHLVQALRTAVDVYERHGRSDYQIARLLFALVPLGYFSSDWRVTHIYGVRAFELGLKITGLGLAHKLRFLLGRKLALKAGLLLAGLRFKRQQKRGLDYGLPEAIASFCGMVPATMGVFTTSLDAKGVSRIQKLVEPLGLFERSQFPALMLGWVEASAHSGQGQALQARVCYEELRRRFQEDPEVRKTLGEGHFKSMYGGLLFGYAVLCTYSAKNRVLELAVEMEGLGIRTWAMSADQIRTLHHAFRGEIEEVRRCRARVELYAVQGNATWQSELFLPAILLNADVLTGDTIGARRTWEQLARRAEEITSLKAYAGAANAAYLALRGALPDAIKAYEEVLPAFPLRQRVMWLAVRGYFAQALNAVGEHARAKQLLSEAIAQLDPADDVLVLSLESRRQLALAEAGLGNHAEAVRVLDGLLRQHADHDNPLLIGLLHKARAEVALMLGDKPGFEANFSAMEQRFRATKNPALIGQWERLAETAVRSGLRPAATLRVERRDASWMTNTMGQRSIAELTAAPDRAEYALWLLLEQARAKAGYLYLWENNSWRLAAASSPAEPPRGLETQLRQRCETSQIESQSEGEGGTVVELPTSGSVSGTTSSSISATTGSLSVNTGATAAPTLDLHMPLPRSLEAEDAFATVIASEIGASLPVQRESATSLPAEHGEHADKTVFIDSAPAPAADESAYRVVVLSTIRAGQRTTVGGVILEVAPYDLFRLRPELLDTVAAALYERCVTSMTQTRA